MLRQCDGAPAKCLTTEATFLSIYTDNRSPRTSGDQTTCIGADGGLPRWNTNKGSCEQTGSTWKGEREGEAKDEGEEALHYHVTSTSSPFTMYFLGILTPLDASEQ
jgi:hypothetical protein